MTVISDNAQLFPHFVRHYKRLGIEEFWVGINSREPDVQSTVVRCLNDTRCRLLIDSLSGIGGNHDQEIVNHWQTLLDPGWFVAADVDEFIELPKPYTRIDEFIRGCDLARDPSIPGLLGPMVDRVSETGRIPIHILQEADLEVQFPVRTNMTKQIIKGSYIKACIHRTEFPVTSGHHHHPDQIRTHNMFRYVVNHYRWCGNFKTRLINRVRSRPNSIEYNNALRYMKRNHWVINMNDPNLDTNYDPKSRLL